LVHGAVNNKEALDCTDREDFPQLAVTPDQSGRSMYSQAGPVRADLSGAHQNASQGGD